MDSRFRGNDGRGPRAKPPRGPNAEWRRPTRSPPIARSARGFFTLTDSRPGIDAHGVLGTALPGNARVSPANGTARPPPVDAGGTRAFPGRPRPCRAPFPRPPPLRFDRAGFARANRFRGVKRPGGRRAPTFPQGRRRPSLAEAVRGCSERFSAILWRVGRRAAVSTLSLTAWRPCRTLRRGDRPRRRIMRIRRRRRTRRRIRIPPPARP